MAWRWRCFGAFTLRGQRFGHEPERVRKAMIDLNFECGAA